MISRSYSQVFHKKSVCVYVRVYRDIDSVGNKTLTVNLDKEYVEVLLFFAQNFL